MGILNKVRSTLSTFRDEIIDSNSVVFKAGSHYSEFNLYDSVGNKINVKVSLYGANIEFIEEPKNVVALGIPLTDVSIKVFTKLSYTSSPLNENDFEVILKPEFQNINKSESHLILYRLNYEKSDLEILWETTKSLKYKGADLYNIKGLLFYNHDMSRFYIGSKYIYVRRKND